MPTQRTNPHLVYNYIPQNAREYKHTIIPCRHIFVTPHVESNKTMERVVQLQTAKDIQDLDL